MALAAGWDWAVGQDWVDGWDWVAGWDWVDGQDWAADREGETRTIELAKPKLTKVLPPAILTWRQQI
jgi:hypothetical protein